MAANFLTAGRDSNQTPVSYLLVAEQVLHHVKRMPGLGPDAGVHRLHLRQRLNKPALSRHGLELTALHGNLPVGVRVPSVLLGPDVINIQESRFFFHAEHLQVLVLHDISLVRRPARPQCPPDSSASQSIVGFHAGDRWVAPLLV